jgi:hypothetical protein
MLPPPVFPDYNFASFPFQHRALALGLYLCVADARLLLQ